jgi:hypothetical protein
MKRIALALALALGGCSPIADRCHDDTLLVSVTLDDASAAADSFDVSISIDGAASVQTTVAHTPGAAAGNLVVTFPHGYPRGHTVAVDVEALVAGNVVGSGSASKPLVGACEVAPLSIAAATAGDLGVADLATADLAGGAADLSPPPDMVCVPTAESGNACFDGIDNDSDGHIDCDDPDCTMAQCVPTPSAGFALGITVLQSSFCPGMFDPQEVINSGLTNGGTDCYATTMGGTCSCAGQMMCFGNLDSYSSGGNVCANDSETVSVDATCRNWGTNTTSTGVIAEGINAAGGQCIKAGAPAKSAAMWTTSDRFCKATSIGGGCPAGNTCVPKLSVQTCELSDGNVACDSGYTASGGPWYADFTDGRVCSCACGSASGGACGNTYAIYTSNDCSGTPAVTVAPLGSSCNIAGATLHSKKIINTTSPTCPGGATATVSGTLAGTGPKTLCCRP